MSKIADKGATEAFLRRHAAYEGDECILWPFARSRAGYGLAVIGGVQKNASRWMCVLVHGEPNDLRLQAAHSCGNPPCVNPRHLRWATAKENQADRRLHQRDNSGERNGKTRLTADDVRAIRAAPPDLEALMVRYGISKGALTKIRNGSRWGHIL